MNAAFAQAAIPEPFRVLGRELQPFTIGHQILLDRVESGFAIDAENPPSYEDLIISVFLCSFTYAEALEQMSSRLVNLRLRLWGWRCGNFDPIEAMSYFRRYIDSHRIVPRYRLVKSGAQSSGNGLPDSLFLKVRLQKDLHYTEEQALNTPYNIALLNYLVVLEAEGVIKFCSAEDLEIERLAQDPEMIKRANELAKTLSGEMKANG